MTELLAPLVGMHAPDGYLEAEMALATGVLAAVVVGWCLWRSASEVDDRQVRLAGLTAAFVFAAQMFNFPVASGTTGHLLGGAMAAVLLGPRLGTLAVTVVVVVQAVLFADGGLTALGYNVVNMAIVPAFGGWALFNLVRRAVPATGAGVVAATGVAAAGSVVLSAVAFSFEWLGGASTDVAFGEVFASMVGVHALIGVGEGIISALAVAAVLASRPDLVAGASDLSLARTGVQTRVGARAFAFGALAVTGFFATVVSQFAVDAPDGLERVAEDHGIVAAARDHALGGSAFADYTTSGIANEVVGLAVAGLVGVALSLAVGYLVVDTSRRLRPSRGI